MGKIAARQPVTDQVGFSTLNTISSAGKFNQWMFDTILPLCDGEILEIGGGIGNISGCFLKNGKSLTITELHDEYCEMLKKQFGHIGNLKQVIQMDITDPAFDVDFRSLFGRFDTVFALNVIEHIKNRDEAMLNCRKLLKAGGNLIILVPAFQSLYNNFDRKLGHFLRFNKKSLFRLMETNGFKVYYGRYFNTAGILGWWFAGSILRKKEIPDGQMRIYNFLVPLFRLIDKLTANFAGLSIITAGKKAE